MNEDPIAQLTEQQKACLRLVGRGMTSKEIAPLLHVSPMTVDTYLKVAIARIGVPTRRDAARRLEQWELSQDLGSQPPRIVAAGFSDEHGSSIEQGRRFSDWLAWLLRLPPIGGRFHDLNIAQIFLLTGRIALISAAVMAAIIALAIGTISLLTP